MYSYLETLACGKCFVLDAKKHFLWYNEKDQYGMMENLSICILIHGMQKVFQGHAGLTLFGAADKPEKLYII